MAGLFKNLWLPLFGSQAERCYFKILFQHITFVSLWLVFLDLLLSFIIKCFAFFMLLYNSEMWKFCNTKHYITKLKCGIVVPSSPNHEGLSFVHAPDPSLY